MFQNLFTQCIVLFTYLQSNSNEYPPSENKPGTFPIYASEQQKCLIKIQKVAPHLNHRKIKNNRKNESIIPNDEKI